MAYFLSREREVRPPSAPMRQLTASFDCGLRCEGDSTQPFVQPVADIVQCGLSGRNILRRNCLGCHASMSRRNLLILLALLVWLAALDDVRNWLIREAA